VQFFHPWADGTEGKNWSGAEVREGVEKNPEEIFFWDYFSLLLTPLTNQPLELELAPDTQTLRLLKLIYNTKRSSDKQSESINV